MGHIHKSKACKQAHPLELSVVMGRNDNMVGGAGAAAHPRQTQGMFLFFHIIPQNST
jgi:ABC-type sugar transport system substrate-binding protein